jgi:hypothetical protein
VALGAGVSQAENSDPPAPSQGGLCVGCSRPMEIRSAGRPSHSGGTIAYYLILRMILSEKSATFGIML